MTTVITLVNVSSIRRFKCRVYFKSNGEPD